MTKTPRLSRPFRASDFFDKAERIRLMETHLSPAGRCCLYGWSVWLKRQGHHEAASRFFVSMNDVARRAGYRHEVDLNTDTSVSNDQLARYANEAARAAGLLPPKKKARKP